MVEKNSADDTVMLLKECDAGIKMAVSAIEDVIDNVENTDLRNLLSDSKSQHEIMKAEVTTLLNEHGGYGKEPSVMAKGMSWAKTNMKMAVDGNDSTIADLITDGCNMGVKSLNGFLNEYKNADGKSKGVTNRLVQLEQTLATNVRQFL